MPCTNELTIEKLGQGSHATDVIINTIDDYVFNRRPISPDLLYNIQGTEKLTLDECVLAYKKIQTGLKFHLEQGNIEEAAQYFSAMNFFAGVGAKNKIAKNHEKLKKLMPSQDDPKYVEALKEYVQSKVLANEVALSRTIQGLASGNKSLQLMGEYLFYAHFKNQEVSLEAAVISFKVYCIDAITQAYAKDAATPTRETVESFNFKLNLFKSYIDKIEVTQELTIKLPDSYKG